LVLGCESGELRRRRRAEHRGVQREWPLKSLDLRSVEHLQREQTWTV